jgi:hypothetical protein
MSKGIVDRDKYLGDIVFTVFATLFFATIASIGIVIPAANHHVEKQWCQSEGGMWLENTCYDKGAEVKLK